MCKKQSQESSFLKKRSKRLLFLRQRRLTGHGRECGSGGEVKVFWFFSSEKNILAFLLCLASTAPAFAHAFLESAIPRVGSTIPNAPPEVTLTFTQGIEPAFSRIDVQDASGASMDAGDAHSVPGNVAEFAVPIKKLAPGTYTVIWHVTSVDTHKTQGKFHFTIGQ